MYLWTLSFWSGHRRVPRVVFCVLRREGTFFLYQPAQPVHITYIYYSFESVTIEYEVEMAWEEYEYVQILYYIIDGIVPYFMFYLSAH